MPLKVYQYPKCSTCRNALKWLDANNLAHTDIDITEQPPSKSELNEMLAHYDGDLRRLFNTSDQMYRALKIKDRLPEMKPPEAIDLLAANGMLINAPSSSPTKPASSALRKTNGRPHCPERTISVLLASSMVIEIPGRDGECSCSFLRQHRLYFSPLPQGQGAFRLIDMDRASNGIRDCCGCRRERKYGEATKVRACRRRMRHDSGGISTPKGLWPKPGLKKNRTRHNPVEVVLAFGAPAYPGFFEPWAGGRCPPAKRHTGAGSSGHYMDPRTCVSES